MGIGRFFKRFSFGRGSTFKRNFTFNFGRGFHFGLRNSVRRRLILTFALVLLAPAVIVSIVSYQYASSGVKKEVMNNATSNVQLINDDITKYIQPEVSNITYLAESIDQLTWSSNGGSDLNNLLSNFSLTHPELFNLEFASTTGYFQSFPEGQEPAGYNPRQSDWYQAAESKNGRVAIENPYRSQMMGGEWVVGISAIVQDGSGVIHAEIPVSTFTKLLSQIKIGHTGYPIIIDNNHKVVVDPAFKVAQDISSESWAKALFAGTNGSVAYTQNGKQKELFFTTNQLTGWKVAGTMYMSDIQSTVQPILYATLIVLLIALLIGIVLVYFNIRSIMRPLRSLLRTSELIRDGDLTESVDVNSKDEFGVLATSFNDMVSSLKTIITEVSQTSDQLAASSEELSASAEETTQATQQIAMSMQSISGGSDVQLNHVGGLQEAISDFEQILHTLATNADDVNSNAEDASRLAENGSVVLNQSVRQMEFINHRMSDITNVVEVLRQRSGEIGDVVQAIASIAGQTNLLALNAAIEAARAGEQGRGFAVVADEVRKLAEESRKMAAQIGNSITLVQADIKRAVESANSGTAAVTEGIQVTAQAGSAFQGILAAVEQVARDIKSVSAAINGLVESTAISSGVRGVYEVAAASAENTTNASAAAQEQMATMEEVAASANSLSQLAERLQDLLARFKV